MPKSPRKTALMIISALMLIVPGLMITPPANAQVYDCGTQEICDAGDVCHPLVNQGSDISKATYVAKFEGNNYDGGYAGVTHTTLLEERWGFTTCLNASVTAYTSGSSALAEIDDCQRTVCVSRAWYDVTIETDRGLGSAYCQEGPGGECTDLVPGERTATKSNFAVNIPNTEVTSENCGLAVVKVKDDLSDPWTILAGSDDSVCGETILNIGMLP